MIRRIAITQREVEAADYAERRDALSHDWTHFLHATFPGAALLPVPNRTPDVSGWLAQVAPDLVVLSGGDDWGSSPDRDKLETRLVSELSASEIPALFTCRGFQALLSLKGTRLSKDIAERAAERHVACAHHVELAGDAFVHCADRRERIEVNSYHAQGALVADLQQNGELVAFARSDHDVLEGCVHRSLPFIGIQWHPERPGSDREFDTAIVTALANEGAFWT